LLSMPWTRNACLRRLAGWRGSAGLIINEMAVGGAGELVIGYFNSAA